jgi:hypothetical protein
LQKPIHVFLAKLVALTNLSDSKLVTTVNCHYQQVEEKRVAVDQLLGCLLQTVSEDTCYNLQLFFLGKLTVVQ